jgi:EmrB/QacA subfamily drug resistance transporter
MSEIQTAAKSARPPAGRDRITTDRRWLTLVVMVGAVLMDLIDITIVNVALPSIKADLGTTAAQTEWVISAYMVAFAAVLIIAGSFGDLFGRKRVFLIGICGFGAASLAAGVAQTPTELIAARFVQGASAAAMVPQLLATIRTIFPAEERGKAFGVYGAILGLASAFGLLLGGVLTNADIFGWGWRSVFVINVPIAVAALVGTLRVVPETREPSAARPDMQGALLLAAAIVAIVYPLLEGHSHGWPVWGWFLLAGGVALLVCLWVVEDRREPSGRAPLLRTELLRIPAFSAGMVTQAAFSAGVQGFFIVFALWIQAGKGFSPLGAGLTTIAFSIGSFVLAGVAIPLAQRYGRLIISGGGLLLAVGAALVALGSGSVGTGTDPWPVTPGLVIAGMGLSLMIIPLANVVLAAVPARAAGGAGGQLSTAQQLGGAIGVAVVGTVFFSALEGHSYTHALKQATPVIAAFFILAALVALALPGTAVADEEAF